MIKKRILDRGRIRRIDGGFAFIPHRFLTDGFLSALTPRATAALSFSCLGSRPARAFFLQLRRHLQHASDIFGSIY